MTTTTLEKLEKIRALNLPTDQFCIVGSLLFEILGIRDADHDIDILVTTELFVTLAANESWQAQSKEGSVGGCVTNDGIDALAVDTFGDTPTARYLANAKQVHGLPFIRLADMLEWKRIANRPKDQVDVKLIESFLQLSKVSA